jgi:LruC domain-containing protein
MEICETKKYMLKVILSILTLGILISSCKKSNVSQSISNHYDLSDDDTMPENFNYRTSNTMEFAIQLNAPDGNPIAGIPVKINQIENDSLVELFVIMTDQNRLAEGTFNVASYINEVVISPNYVGVPDNILVPLTGTIVNMNITGARISNNSNYQSWVSPLIANQAASASKTRSILPYRYLSSYNSLGVPSNLATNGLVTAQMLSYINNSVPEYQPVPTYHPNYLTQGYKTDIDIIQTSEVWLTFVHEGAGYTNSLGYYKYPTNNPPTSASQIDSVYLVFPNASYYNSGGGLHSGNRVSIGTFQPGTSIGFVCISNGWNGTAVGDGYFRLFSDKNLNSQTNPALKQQSILLYDNTNQQCYICFEDIKRDQASCDNDFNDLVFYAKANPINGISINNVASVDNGVDSDGDGVSDAFDAFPNNSNLAYKNTYPSAQQYGTLSFEDLWPGKGDYDFNDLVVAYQYETWSNAQNKVKEMKCRFAIKAIGAHYSHGFGFQLNSAPSSISSVSGSQIFDNYISRSSNGTESAQTLATIIAFDNDYKVAKRAAGNTLNTELSKSYSVPDTVSLNVVFTSPLSAAQLGTAPFNPFMIINGTRGKEVHLAGYAPTSLANSALFGTLQDNTKPSSNRYYKTKNNLPFAIDLPENYLHLAEKNAINAGYLKFVQWAQSSGSAFPDWYKNLTGYRDATKLYSK